MNHEPTLDQMKELERLAVRMARWSRWAVTEAAFRLGLKRGAETAMKFNQPIEAIEREEKK